MTFSDADIMQIHSEGLSMERVMEQIALFVRGASHIELNRPCTAHDGIEVIPNEDEEGLIARYDQAAAAGRCMKFVPASGAASRMFKEWFRALDQPWKDSESSAVSFAEQLEHYPFYDNLRQAILSSGGNIDFLMEEKKYGEVLAYILTSRGLQYGQLPKALLKFHKYQEASRTSLEEHLVEAALYVTDARHISRLHITVSPEHRQPLETFLDMVRPLYEGLFSVTYEIGVSCQENATNTIAVDMENRPFRSDDGQLCFRPGGHGALLNNLNDIDGDIIFLKNIDNVAPDRLKPVTVRYKKALAGLLLKLQEETFSYLECLAGDRTAAGEMTSIDDFCRDKLHIVFPIDYRQWPLEKKKEIWREKLDRPIRICGVVRNEGEPGGGPFWVQEANGAQSLQIVEEMQIDPRSVNQQDLWRGATHFNPVDLVCGVRNFEGGKFDLQQFVDPGAISMSIKSEKGRDLKAIELPGLWNGSMAQWNTIFVEVPIETFNPVKTVEDLLRPQHLS
ncbi:MAG: DUF4301 family protein [Syntrophales bacterium]|jgi:hypothetical protein|nr:DUF4301 family protein [Syntrophales bacterium]MCK9390061.1 DUF4301 family protein [Syntrophales bacterium]